MAEIIDGNTIDMVKENLKKLQEIYPEAFIEGKVDPQKLLLLLGEDVDSSNEKYSFTWKGKNDCIRLAQSPSKGTLLPCKEESVDWDTTKNLYIEGDNLEVLKLLQKSYLGKVKMIYIDPPYNTGNDFVYEDDFSDNIENYKQITGQVHKSNSELTGRYHTKWLNMIYPRLKLARTLLSDDGAIFISIGDDEEANLVKVCDEIFGEQNFISSICHKSRASVSNDRIISENHNHLLFYAKNINVLFENRLSIGEDPDISGFVHEDEKGFYKLTPVDGPGGAKKGNPHYEFLGVEGYWRYSKETMQQKYEQGLIVRTANGLQQKYYKQQAENSRKTVTTWWDEGFLTSSATSELIKLMGAKTFDSPKNVAFILRMLKMITKADKDAIVLDFFSGSATTAHSIMQLNAEDNGNRKFIMVQLPEICAEYTDAYKAGYNNICEVGKERIRRAGKLIKEQNSNVDTGFRVFKLDSSNLTKWDNSPTDDPNEVAKRINDSLFYLQPDRTEIDFVYEIMLKLGMPLSKNVELSTIGGKKVYGVKDGAYSILICLEYNVDFELVEKMAESEYDVLIFADRCFANANMLINTEEILKKKGKTLKLF